MICPCRMLYHICKVLKKNVVYLSPTDINQRCITSFELLDNAAEFKDMINEGRQHFRKALHNSLKYQVATYVYTCMKSVEEHGCLMAPYWFR